MSFLNKIIETNDEMTGVVNKVVFIIKCGLAGVFFSVGLTFFIIVVRSWSSEIQFMKEAIPVTAVVDEINKETWEDSDRDVHVTYYAFVNYTVDGVNYEHIDIGAVTSGYYEGDEIEVFYDPDNHEDARAYYDTNGGYIIFLIFSLVFMAVPVLMFTAPKQRGIRQSGGNRLKRIGECRYLPVKRIEVDYNIVIKDEHPHWVICEDVNTLENTIYLYRSDRVFSEEVYDIKAGDKVAVYIHPKNPDKYFVDLNDVMPADRPYGI